MRKFKLNGNGEWVAHNKIQQPNKVTAKEVVAAVVEPEEEKPAEDTPLNDNADFLNRYETARDELSKKVRKKKIKDLKV